MNDEQKILVDGIPVPLSMAGAAVGRCIRAIQITERLIQQGFASQDDLEALKRGLTGEDQDNAAPAEGVIQ
jgi:hypothetical protein